MLRIQKPSPAMIPVLCEIMSKLTQSRCVVFSVQISLRTVYYFAFFQVLRLCLFVFPDFLPLPPPPASRPFPTPGLYVRRTHTHTHAHTHTHITSILILDFSFNQPFFRSVALFIKLLRKPWQPLFDFFRTEC